MALSEADRQRARELAEQAPPPSAELLSRIRAILTGCVPALAAPEVAPEAKHAQDGAADAA